jgi:hypothetical protein
MLDCESGMMSSFYCVFLGCFAYFIVFSLDVSAILLVDPLVLIATYWIGLNFILSCGFFFCIMLMYAMCNTMLVALDLLNYTMQTNEQTNGFF